MGTGTVIDQAIDVVKSVGWKGKDQQTDVKIVFDLLKQVPKNRGGLGQPTGDIFKMGLKSQSKRAKAIRDFQMHHFGVATGRIDPANTGGGMTMAHLVKEVTGKRAPGKVFMSPESFKAIVNYLRNQIVAIATTEANRSDRPRGVSKKAPTGARNKKQAARLKEYFTAFNQKVRESDYTQGLPGGYRWCGIFAVWAINQALEQSKFFTSRLQFNMGGKIFSNANGTGFDVRQNFHQGGGYSKGDICLVKEHAEEKWPTHHFIVAEDPKPGARFKTIEGNYVEKGLWHAVTKNTRPIANYGYLSVLQPAKM